MVENINVQEVVDTYVVPWGINAVLAIVIFFIGKWGVGVLTNFIKKLMVRAEVDALLVNFVGSIISSVLLLFVVIAALSQLGVDTTSLIAFVGAAGLAIGLALQSSLQNFASGVMLIIFRPFEIGDFVEAAGVSGGVEKIGIFTTVMRTGDNREIIIPNGDIFGGTITNFSARDTRRIDMVFGISYDDDIKKAKETIQKILNGDTRILKDPAPLVAVAELADSSVKFNVRPWCKTEDYWGVFYDVQENIKIAFDEQGITIPYPQMDVYQHTT